MSHVSVMLVNVVMWLWLFQCSAIMCSDLGNKGWAWTRCSGLVQAWYCVGHMYTHHNTTPNTASKHIVFGTMCPQLWTRVWATIISTHPNQYVFLCTESLLETLYFDLFLFHNERAHILEQERNDMEQTHSGRIRHVPCVRRSQTLINCLMLCSIDHIIVM